MPTIWCHPANAMLLRNRLREEKQGVIQATGLSFSPFDDYSYIDIRENVSMDREKPTGRYIFPDGRVVARDDVRIEERFWEYGPEDIEYLLYARKIREEMTALFILVNDPPFRMLADFMPSMPKHSFVTNCLC